MEKAWRLGEGQSECCLIGRLGERSDEGQSECCLIERLGEKTERSDEEPSEYCLIERLGEGLSEYCWIGMLGEKSLTARLGVRVGQRMSVLVVQRLRVSV